MAATISGFLEIVEKLMRLGADLYLKSCNEMTVLGKNFSMNFFYIIFFYCYIFCFRMGEAFY